MNPHSRTTDVDITGTFPHLALPTARMETSLLIIAREVVTCRDAWRGLILFHVRIPSSDCTRKCACVAAKREADASGMMTLFGTS
jgi:hypothetical protein